MPKNAYFWEKSCKIAATSGAPESPLAFGSRGFRPQTIALIILLIAVAFVEERFYH